VGGDPCREADVAKENSDDPFQFAVYAAEDSALPDGGRQFTRFAQLERYVSELVVDEWWSETFPHAPIDVDVQRRSRSANASVSHVDDAGDAAVLLIRPGQWNALTVVHELAHVAAWGHPATEGSHGATFAATLLVLWRRHLGVFAYGALRSGFDEREVPYRRDLLDRSAP